MINEATFQYVFRHVHDDVRMLALRGCKDPEVDLPFALQQIQGWQTARRKLPSWAATDHILYPPHLNMEQCSSELTARYKREIADRILSQDTGQSVNRKSVNRESVNRESVNRESVNRKSVNRKSVNRKFLDATGGFGVDFSFMSDAFDEAVYVERAPGLCTLAARNLALLGKKNVSIICADAVSYLNSVSSTADEYTLIYLDPARRDAHGGRTYALADCTPDVTAMMERLLMLSRYVLLKLSPMLDWRKAVADLAPHHVQEVHIVAVDNECKELLLLVRQDSGEAKGEAPRLVCIDIHSRDGSRTVYTPLQSPACNPQSPIFNLPSSIFNLPSSIFNLPSSILYEPNAAMMKAGCFHELAADFGIEQLAPNSHLFTSANPVTDFPGRCFRITAVTSMSKRDLRSTLGHLKRANISVRNFPLSADELRRRLKLADGGTDYIFATTLYDGTHVVILCTKLPS